MEYSALSGSNIFYFSLESFCNPADAIRNATVFLFSAMNDFWVPVQQKQMFMLAAASSSKTFRPGWRLADYLLLDWIDFMRARIVFTSLVPPAVLPTAKCS
jgi:hypothetical protein